MKNEGQETPGERVIRDHRRMPVLQNDLQNVQSINRAMARKLQV